jgi:hypothetical protein
MHTTNKEQLSATDAQPILACLPERIRTALITRADVIEYPIEAVVEMAIASFLDSLSLGLCRL